MINYIFKIIFLYVGITSDVVPIQFMSMRENLYKYIRYGGFFPHSPANTDNLKDYIIFKKLKF